MSSDLSPNEVSVYLDDMLQEAVEVQNFDKAMKLRRVIDLIRCDRLAPLLYQVYGQIEEPDSVRRRVVAYVLAHTAEEAVMRTVTAATSEGWQQGAGVPLQARLAGHPGPGVFFAEPDPNLLL